MLYFKSGCKLIFKMKYTPNTIEYCFDFIVFINYVNLKLCSCWCCSKVSYMSLICQWLCERRVRSLAKSRSCHRCPLYFIVSAWSGSLRDSVNSQEEKEWWRQASLSNTCLDLKKTLGHLANMDRPACHASTTTFLWLFIT